ncbi:MAG: GxxExxY protein [Chloroflexi bacterium]|nr:GxxExxY protein [Chloroflexota bacterium]MCI0578143.1 GxxExxY protein [Chloroflexota bacterium]MCI0649863.1 GxxExxY protein [Chloroflexota bacterium]MCI0730275.1 GxxExxY protein [Chloroflexota bacterium]
MNRRDLNRLTEKVIGAAIEVHRHLGPGLLESTGRPVGLLLNFNVKLLKDGIRRFITT